MPDLDPKPSTETAPMRTYVVYRGDEQEGRRGDVEDYDEG